MAATLRDVASLAGVSFKTVSNVLNDYPYVSSDTRARVLAAIERLDYTPNAAARVLKAGRTNTVSVALPDLSQAYWGDLASDLTHEARRHGLRVLIEQTDGSRERELEILAGASRHVTDGLILSPLSLRTDDLTTVRGSTPLVLLGETLFPEAIDHVGMQNHEAARAATEVLLQLGRRRIAFIGTTPTEGLGVGTSQLRSAGYSAALDRAGVPERAELLLSAGTFHRTFGELAVQSLLEQRIEFDAVFAITDELAIGALRALHSAGVGVPDDVAVIGFDDIEDGRYTEPSLSTVDPGRHQIAALAVEAVVRRIEDPEASYSYMEGDFRVVRRGSA